jgi:hypothetical protein
LPQCNTGDYAIETSNICIRDCQELTDKVYYSYISSGNSDPNYKVNTCVSSCPNSKPYAHGQICKDICPEEKRYFVREFLHGEVSHQKVCLNDCPNDYQFYTIRRDGSHNYYECQPSCEGGYYIPNTDTSKKAKLCLSGCPDSVYTNYKYKIENGYNKTCYEVCPSEKPYHKSDSGSECLAACPNDAPFHEEGDYICKREGDCSGTFIDYETKICLASSILRCPFPRKFTTISTTSTGKKFC